MIRPLRQLHRIVWPALGVAVAVALLLASQLKQAHPGHAHADAADYDNDSAAFIWQWRLRDGQTILQATPVHPLRASTGVADVYTIDADAASPAYLASLSAMLDGISMPVRTAEQPVTLRIFDVANNVWLGPAFTVAER